MKTSDSNPKASPESIVNFLETYRPGGPWLLAAIGVDKGGLTAMRFTEAKAAAAWAVKKNLTKNLYFLPNTTLTTKNKKPSKSDMATVESLHVDCDPRPGKKPNQERLRILGLLENPPDGVVPPTWIIDSGGGYQALWKLDTPILPTGNPKGWEQAECLNRWLAKLLDADNCWNVDRILRLPGTVNIPNNKKRAEGRVRALAKVVHWNDVSYPQSAFQRSESLPKRKNSANGNVSEKLTSINSPPLNTDYLKKWAVENQRSVSHLTLTLIETGAHPTDPSHFPSRSEALFCAVCSLVRSEIPEKVIFGLITNPSNKISESVLAQTNWQAYASRQIERARTVCTEPELAEMNQKHALIHNEGGKVRVLHWEPADINSEKKIPCLQSTEDFCKRYMNQNVAVQNNKNVTLTPLGTYWLRHPKRRDYLGLRFFPGLPEEIDGYLNLWRGFSVESKPGDWSKMQSHIREILANGNAEHADYILRWAAWTIQNPDKPAEVALVFKGSRGTGKGAFARPIKHLFGQHGLQINTPQQLTGRFNAHLRNCCLLFADEAIAPGDKAAESVLKGLITEPELTIEGKGANVITTKNLLHIVMASNENWVVPAGIDERRFAVFEVSNARKQDHGYFRTLTDQLNKGGLPALLHDLLSMKLGDWHPRQYIPQTAALHAQQAASLNGSEAILFDCLAEGMIPVCRWVGVNRPLVSTTAFQTYAQLRLKREDVSLNAVAKLMHELGFEHEVKSRPRGFVLPPLADARAAWDQARMPFDWNTTSDWAELTNLENNPVSRGSEEDPF